MTYLNITEKLEILFNTLIDYKLILLFASVVIILTILYVFKRLSGNGYVKGISLSLLFSLIISFIVNQDGMSKVFDSVSTKFFENIYFPSVYTYTGIILILLISTILTAFNKNSKKVYKIINSSAFIINSTLFVLLLNIIANNDIDIFSIESLYTNMAAVVALEISTGVFVLWICAMVVAYSTNVIVDKILNREISVEKLVNNIPEINILNEMETKPAFISSYEEEIELPKLKQPEVKPIFNYFNLPSNDKAYINSDNIEIFSVDKYNLKFNEA